MHDSEMLIKTEHYNSLNKRCLDLEKEMEELKGKEGMVIVEDKNIKALEGENRTCSEKLVSFGTR